MEIKKYTIGIDLGGTNTKIALVAANGRIVRRTQFPTKAHKDKPALINAIASEAFGIIKLCGLKKSQVQGIGIGVPGLVDSKRGVVHYLTNISGWKHVNLSRELEKKTGIKTRVDNDVNLMALAEARFGAGRDSASLFCVTLGTGVGGGIVIDGEIYRGNTQSAGEIGHISVDPEGPKCNCGRKGCVEAYVGNSYVVKRAEQKMRKKGITPEQITKAAKKGDRAAMDIWKETAEYLGRGLVIVINLFDPETIVIGGGMIGAGEFIFKPLRGYIRKNALIVPAARVKIVKAKLGNNAGVIGAAELARGMGN